MGQRDHGCRGHDGVTALLGEGVVAGEGDGQGRQLVAADDEKEPEEGFPGPALLFGVLRAESQRSVFCAGNWWWSGWYGGRYGIDGGLWSVICFDFVGGWACLTG